MREEDVKLDPAEQPLGETPETAAAAPESPEAQAPEAEAPDGPKGEAKKGKDWFPKKDKAAEALKTKLDSAEKAAEELKEKLLRTAAEYDNFRKRSAREQDAAFGNGLGFAVEQILPILDTLEMAMAAPCTDENYKKGVEMTLTKAASALANLKVEEIPALGQPFDPNLMSAVQQQPVEEGQESGTVVRVYQKGYKLGERVIRHATVVVAE